LKFLITSEKMSPINNPLHSHTKKKPVSSSAMPSSHASVYAYFAFKLSTISPSFLDQYHNPRDHRTCKPSLVPILRLLSPALNTTPAPSFSRPRVLAIAFPPSCFRPGCPRALVFVLVLALSPSSWTSSSRLSSFVYDSSPQCPGSKHISINITSQISRSFSSRWHEDVRFRRGM